MIQRNALASWTRLHADVEVILFGDDAGAATISVAAGADEQSSANAAARSCWKEASSRTGLRCGLVAVCVT